MNVVVSAADCTGILLSEPPAILVAFAANKLAALKSVKLPALSLYCHLGGLTFSFHLIYASLEVPRLTLTPPFCVGPDVSDNPLLTTTKLPFARISPEITAL